MILLQVSLLLIPIGVYSKDEINGEHLSSIDRCHSLFRSQSSFNVSKIKRLDGLVGVGWDNLINTVTAPVLALTYFKCLTTPDEEYVLPDNVVAIPVQKSTFDQMAKYYDSYEAYVQHTKETINVEADVGFDFKFGSSISGSYSSTRMEAKMSMHDYNSSMLHARYRLHAYTLVADGSDGLHPGFARRLEEVAEARTGNLTLRAGYLAELVIRDYGTHVVTSADVGAVIERENYIVIDKAAMNQSTINKVMSAVSAGVSFGSIFNFGAKESTEKTESADTIKLLTEETRHVVVRSQGGPSPSRVASGKDTYEMDSLIALDVRGVPLYTLINKNNLPSLNDDQLVDLSRLLLNVTREYYGRNRVPGCTSRLSPNFNFNANVDDNSCTRGVGNYTFGGIYTTCTVVPSRQGNPPASQCAPFIQPNFVTGNLSCDDGFEPVLMLHSVLQLPDRIERVHDRFCADYFFFTDCDDYYFNVVHQDRVTVEAFWCRPKPGVPPPTDRYVMFGGLYMAGHPNQITNEMGCPGHYREFPLLKTTTLCLSRDYQLDVQYAAELQNLFSCQSPKSEQICAQGFSQHLATVVNDCEVYYCVRNEAYNKVKPQLVKRPPFTSPDAMHNSVSEDSLLIYMDNQLWGIAALDAVLQKGKQLIPAANLVQSVKETPEDLNSQAIDAWINYFMKDEREAEKIVKRTNAASYREKTIDSTGHYSIWTITTSTIIALVIGAMLMLGGIKAIEWRRRRAQQQGQYQEMIPRDE